MKRKNLVIILVSVFAFLMLLGGTSYAYFIYNKNIADVSLETGNISLSFSNSNNATLTNLVPLSNNHGKKSSTYIDFTVTGTVDTDRIYYEVYLVPQNTSTMSSNNINNYVRTYLTDQGNVEIRDVRLYKYMRDSTRNNGKIVYQAIIEPNSNGTVKNESKNFRLRLWLDEDYNGSSLENFDFNLYLYAINVDEEFEIPPDGTGKVKKAIENKINAETGACNPIYENSNIQYFSGTNACVDMNYVWYSGKLWRITAIYPNNTMKMITENNITTIAFNPSASSDATRTNFYNSESSNSYAYKWLNEEFYDTLYHPDEFIDTTILWNYTRPPGTGASSIPTETDMVNSKAGLLNNYEYYNSYRKSSAATGYLNIKYYWWLINSRTDSTVWRVNQAGSAGGNNSSGSLGIRPAVYLKAGLDFTGAGTIDNPFKIVGDKEIGAVNERINTRLSGEYVKLKNGNNEQLFRIVGMEDNTTKIIAMDYADNSALKVFATSTGTWGSGTTTDPDTWYTYLNTPSTGYFATLQSNYGDLFASATYYLGVSSYNYKSSVCANTTSGNTRVCTKKTDKLPSTSNPDPVYIGLPRYGEMFAAQQGGGGTENVIPLWLINGRTSSTIWAITANGNATGQALTETAGARPTVHLKSEVKILSGSGTESDPYVVGL